MAVSKASEVGEITVHRHELAAVLDGKCSVMSVSHQLAARASFATEASKDLDEPRINATRRRATR
jgi:hypothetical protein